MDLHSRVPVGEMSGMRTVTPLDIVEAAATTLGTGWLLLRDCPIDDGGRTTPFVLLHPRFGVAIVDKSPSQANAAEDRLRRALRVRRFDAIFGGSLPVVSALILPDARPVDLAHAIAAGFAGQLPLSLAGGDAWIGLACRAIEARGTPPMEALEPSFEARRSKVRRSGRPAPGRRRLATRGVVALLVVALAAAVAVETRSPQAVQPRAEVAAPAHDRDGPLGLAASTPSMRPIPPDGRVTEPEASTSASTSPGRDADDAPGGAARLATGMAQPAPSADAPAVVTTPVRTPEAAVPELLPRLPPGSPPGLPPGPPRVAASRAGADVRAAVVPDATERSSTAAPTVPAAPRNVDRTRGEVRKVQEAPRPGGTPAALAGRQGDARCQAIVAKTQLGGVLEEADRSYLRTGCAPGG